MVFLDAVILKGMVVAVKASQARDHKLFEDCSGLIAHFLKGVLRLRLTLVS